MVTDLFVPPCCVGCERRGQGAWCGNCVRALSALALPARPDDLAPSVKAVGAYAYEGVVRDAILAVKTRGRHDALAQMGSLLRRRVRLPPAGPRLAWTWVPTSRRSLQQRVADVPRKLAGPTARPLLGLVRDVPDQTSLDAVRRRRSPRGAFAAIARVPPAVVVFDDVRTTGGTAEGVAEALRDGGARRILVVTFAVAGHQAIPVGRAGDPAPDRG